MLLNPQREFPLYVSFTSFALHHSGDYWDKNPFPRMEVGLSSFRPRTHLRSFLLPSSSSSPPPAIPSVSVSYDQAALAFTSLPTSSPARHFPTSVLLQEQRNEYIPQMQLFKDDKTSQATLVRRQMENESTVDEENFGYYDQLVLDLKSQLLQWPGLWSSWPYLEARDYTSSPVGMQSHTTNGDKLLEFEPSNVIALAQEALSASKQAASIAKESQLVDESLDSSLIKDFPIEERITKSTRLHERRSKKRRMGKQNVTVIETKSTRRENIQRQLSEGFDLNDPLRLFLWGPETRQLLTKEEESSLIIQIQDVIQLEEVKARLQSQFCREPTLVEWAAAIGLNSHQLKTRLHSGHSSREKLINANLRMVVHIAKQYQGRGLILHDLLQEGSMGLMKSVEKFKPQAGCRFATYAYWWIRQSIRKAIFQHSRTIRLPENVYSLLGKVKEAKKFHIGKGNHNPSKEELARSVGITIEKLDKLLYVSRVPLSMQQPVWSDQDTTFQEITADTGIEVPDVSVTKELMRRHVRGLLRVLSSKERQIIRLRFGIEDGKERTLQDIGNLFGLSKERVRQLETRAMYKLKRCCTSHGLGAYANLLT